MTTFFILLITSGITAFLTLGTINLSNKIKARKRKKYASILFEDLCHLEYFLNTNNIKSKDIINITYDEEHKRWVIIYKGI